MAKKKIKFNLKAFKNNEFDVRCVTKEEAKSFTEFLVAVGIKNGVPSYEQFNYGWARRHSRYGLYFRICQETRWNQERRRYEDSGYFMFQVSNYPSDYGSTVIKFENLILWPTSHISEDELLDLLAM